MARLNTLGELAAGMAHELNQPLTAVLANTQAAQRLLAEDPPELDTARQAMAQMVSVGFLSGLVTKGAASATKTFLTSCACEYLLSALVFGSEPMRTVPNSWMISPGVEIARVVSATVLGPFTRPPMPSMMAAKVSCMCLTILSS